MPDESESFTFPSISFSKNIPHTMKNVLHKPDNAFIKKQHTKTLVQSAPEGLPISVTRCAEYLKKFNSQIKSNAPDAFKWFEHVRSEIYPLVKGAQSLLFFFKKAQKSLESNDIKERKGAALFISNYFLYIENEEKEAVTNAENQKILKEAK